MRNSRVIFKAIQSCTNMYHSTQSSTRNCAAQDFLELPICVELHTKKPGRTLHVGIPTGHNYWFNCSNRLPNLTTKVYPLAKLSIFHYFNKSWVYLTTSTSVLQYIYSRSRAHFRKNNKPFKTMTQHFTGYYN